MVVCTYNGARNIDHALEAVAALRYENFEVIVVNDGSTDSTADIARKHRVHLIDGPNRGLSHARNAGLHAASGEIVASR